MVKHKKSGMIYLLAIAIIIALFMLFSLYIIVLQNSIIISSVKNTVYYLAQNSILDFDKDNLGLDKYEIDLMATRKRIENLLKLEEKNFKRFGIKNVSIGNIELVKSKKDKEINQMIIEMNFDVEPIIMKQKIKTKKIKMKEYIKMNLMEI
ncbi:MAG: hypothetical protein RR922_01875 [Clostridia bacterium]